MPFVRLDYGRRRVDVSPPAHAADRHFPVGLARVPLYQPDLSSLGSRSYPSFLRADFLWCTDLGYYFGAAGAQSSGNRADEARLQWIYSTAVDLGGDPVC